MRTKREILMCSLLEFPEIEKRLEKRAAEGWRLKRAGTLFWTYEEAEPKKVHYSLVFFPKTDALDPEPSESLVMMREFCEKVGWRLVAEQGQMQVFCNEEPNPVPIETEAWIQVKNIHESMKKNTVLSYGILFVNAVLQIFFQVMQFVISPLNWMSMGFNFYLLWCWIALGIGCGAEIIQYYTWYRKAKRVAEEEEELYLPKSRKAFRIGYLAFALVSLFFATMALADFTTGTVGLLIIVLTTVMVGVPIGMSRLLKKWKVSAKWNRAIILVLAIVCTIGMVAAIVAFVVKSTDSIFRRDEEMSLQIRNFREVKEENVRGSSRRSDSIFFSQEEGYQSERLEEGDDVSERSSMEYTILVIKMPFIYDFCKQELMAEEDKYYVDEELGQRGYRKVDMPQWGAEEVYRHYNYDGEAQNKYFVCYTDRMIQIDFGWEVTDADIAKVKEVISEMK